MTNYNKLSTASLQEKLKTANKTETAAINLVLTRRVQPSGAGAKKKPAPVVAAIEEEDDLLGGLPAAKEAESTDELDDLLGGPVVAKVKEKKVAAPRQLKGDLVTFTTKGTGQTITGYGVLYYVTRYNGKLYYKEASQVTVLPADTKVKVDHPDEKLL